MSNTLSKTLSHIFPAGALRLGRRLAGPLLMLGIVILVEVISRTLFVIPTPGVILAIPVVLAAFDGGTAPGLASAAIGLVYLVWTTAIPDRASLYFIPDVVRLA